MAIFQKAPATREEIDAGRPLELPPDQVLELSEEQWYRRVYRGENVAQLTVRAVLMGSALGFLLAFTNVYIGLKTGWHLGVAITACILSFTVWNFFQKVGLAKTPMTILENNCMQSTASAAGYSTGSTLVSAFPALLMLSVTPENARGTHTPVWVIVGWTLAVAVLGTVLAIPLKRSMINQERLRFPSGTAAAVTLQSLYAQGSESLAKARALLVAALFGMLVPILKDLNSVATRDANGQVVRDTLLPGQSKIFDGLGSITIAGKSYALSDFGIKLDHGIALVAAGALVGLRVTVWMMAGAVLLAALTPTAMTDLWTSPSGQLLAAVSAPAKAWKEIGLWLGAPLMVASGLTSFLLGFSTVLRAFSSLRGRTESADAELAERVARTEVPFWWFATGGAAAAIPLVLIAWYAFGVPPQLGLLAVAMTFFLSMVACRATGESDVTPTGAMGKIMQLTYGVLMPQSATANLTTAAITSGSASASADLLNDLKSGYLLGAHPRRQFIAQALGTLAGTVASVLGYYLLVPDATVFTGSNGHEPAFAAPAAQQWRAVAEVFRLGLENLHPLARSCIVIGALLGVALAALERFSPAHVKKWIPSATGLGLGLILPFYSTFAMFLGALITEGCSRFWPKASDRLAIAIASGLIAGESIVGVIVAGLNNFVLK